MQKEELFRSSKIGVYSVREKKKGPELSGS